MNSDYDSFKPGRFDRLFATEDPRCIASGIRCFKTVRTDWNPAADLISPSLLVNLTCVSYLFCKAAFLRCRYGSGIADDHVIVKNEFLEMGGWLIVTSESMGSAVIGMLPCVCHNGKIVCRAILG